MTNELEKQFFDTFGIEPKLKTFAIKRDEQGELTYPPIYEYPQITDTHYLKLICILGKELRTILHITSENLEDLKKEILRKNITSHYCYSDELAPNHQWFYEYEHQVRTLFEEG